MASTELNQWENYVNKKKNETHPPAKRGRKDKRGSTKTHSAGKEKNYRVK